MASIVTIIGITGAQQHAVAAHFAAAGWRVRGTSRTTATTLYGPAAYADPATGDGLAAALDGSDVVVLTLPQDHRAGVMPRIAGQVARAAAAAGAGRLVLNTAGTIAEHSAEPLFVDLRAARDAVSSGTTPWVVVQPTVFMDNLLAPWSLPAIAEQGVLAYPAPEAAPIAWLSHRSLAAFIHAAATHPDAPGRNLRVGGPEALVGAELGERLSYRLGRPIAYRRIPRDAFAAGLDQAYGPPAGQRIASLYAWLESEPAALAVDAAANRWLAVTPESFEAFAARHDWSSAPAPAGQPA